MLALLIYSYANGIFSSRRIERATDRDIGVRFVAANVHPDHDTIAVFRKSNKPRRVQKRKRPVRPMRQRRPPMMQNGADAAARRSRLTMTRRRNAKAT